MGIVTHTLSTYDTHEKIKELTDEFNQYLNKNNKVHENQVKCAIEGLKMYDSNQPRPNHLVVKGKTQAGKTGVLTSMIMIIRKFGLEGAMGLSKIYYITGDNTTKLVKQSSDRLSDCFRGENLSCELICWKNSDLKKDIKNVYELTNAIIFIDESHYGTSSERNILVQWLDSKGLDLKNNKNLVGKNVYVASNSATPYSEIVSDMGMWKSYVSLETAEGYIGFEEFYGNDNIKPVQSAIGRCNAEDRFVEFRAHLDYIKNTTGKEKCAIVRVNGKSFNKYRDIAERYFNIDVVDASRTEIPYDSIHYKLEHDYEFDIDGKPLMLIIKGAYRMGITIPLFCKENIGLVFDFAGDDVKTTEQGLLGRMTGYWGDNENWKNLYIYVNKKHIDGLFNYYIDGKAETPDNSSHETFVPDENGSTFGFQEYEGEVYIPCDKEFGDRYNTEIKEYLESICDSFSHTAQDFKNLLLIPGRKKTKSFTGKKAIFNEKEHRAIPFLTEENCGKDCYTFLYNPFEKYIHIKYAKIVKGEVRTVYTEKTKPVPTMLTESY